MNRPQAKDYQVKNDKGENVCFQYSRYIADLNAYIDYLENRK